MNATTVNEFAQRCAELAGAIVEAKPQNMSDEDFEEYLQKMGPFEAARILREIL